MTPSMAAPTTRARATWVTDRVTTLPEVWSIVALHLGLVGAWRLMLVCKAARIGARDFLSTLPGLVVCGGFTSDIEPVKDVWRLDLAKLRWEVMPALVDVRAYPACCAVRSSLVIIGGTTRPSKIGESGSVRMLLRGDEAYMNQPPLSCSFLLEPVAIAMEESNSAAGQVLLLGGRDANVEAVSSVYLVDLATGRVHTATKSPP